MSTVEILIAQQDKSDAISQNKKDINYNEHYILSTR